MYWCGTETPSLSADLPTLYGYERIRAGAQGPRIFVQTEPNKLVQTDRFILRLHDIAQVQGGVVGMTENDIHYLAQPLLFSSVMSVLPVTMRLISTCQESHPPLS